MRLLDGMEGRRALDGDPGPLADLIDGVASLGVTTIDHADLYGGYGALAAFGKALAHRPGLRDRLQLVTKCGIQLIGGARPQNTVKHYDTTAPYIRESVDRSRRALGVDRIDVFLIHRPDPLMNASETADALAALLEDGLVGAVGVSNFSPAQFDLLQSRLDAPLVTNQVEASVLQTRALDDGSLDHAQMLRRRPMFWSPLGGARLFDGSDAQAARVHSALADVASEVGAPGPVPVALAWLLHLPSDPVVVVGSTRLARVEEAVAATELRLTRQQWFRILEASRGEPVA